jgi:SAM-dependent methyltransferase
MEYGSENKALDEFRLVKEKAWPVEDASVDLCCSDWVVEHVEDINFFFCEAVRVLRMGGFFCFRTPNKLHYGSVWASFIPDRLHYKVRQMLGHFHEENDVFPTFYWVNTRRRCLSLMKRHGFEGLVIQHCGLSHLMDVRYWPELLGKWVEECSPAFFWHKIHAFGGKDK